jgi:hypothetical protein
MFGTTQTACTAVAAAAAGAAFAVAGWLPFVSAAIATGVALVAAAVIWRPVAGHVHPALDLADLDGDLSDRTPAGSRAGQAAVGVSIEVQ